MTNKVLFIIDDIQRLNYKKDSSLLMMHGFQTRAYQVFVTSIEQLGFSTASGAYTIANKVTLYDDYYKRSDFIATFSDATHISLNQMNKILMRKGPPVNEAYLNALKILNLVDKTSVSVINPTDTLHIFNEKLFAFEFPDIIPASCYTSNKEQALLFAQQYDKVILKPIDGMGGKGIFISHKADPNFSVIFETLSQNFTQSVLIQEFLPAISDGDKRILIVNGHIFDHALARIPATGQIRGNLAVGGSYQVKALSKQDYMIAEQVAERLKQEKIMICGIDVIGDKLTEINITSPTCFQELYHHTGRNPFDLFFI